MREEEIGRGGMRKESGEIDRACALRQRRLNRRSDNWHSPITSNCITAPPSIPSLSLVRIDRSLDMISSNRLASPRLRTHVHKLQLMQLVSRALYKKKENAQLVFLQGGKDFNLKHLQGALCELLSEGASATAYKFILQSDSTLFVKELKGVELEEAEFHRMVEQIGSFRDDKYVVPPMAYYYSLDKKLLVYKCLPKSSLSVVLHGYPRHTPYHYQRRFSIALSVARALSYIHAAGPTSSHGHINSSNILLTNSYEARVTGHGLATLVGLVPSSHACISGYMAPEVTDLRKFSQKADVYSFGVLLLELLTGKDPTQILLNEGIDLPRWVQSVAQSDWTSKVFDRKWLCYGKVKKIEEMEQLVQLAIDCVAQHPDSRPHIADVADRIEDIMWPGNNREGRLTINIESDASPQSN
ncbi:Leucine-rich repeat protein kinase family protein [Rhynchospora pubera]|uniref:Leucine-rich repeat protein kinase family protein n=2 Tax=Rhynchospora pubera TaxID=906938 RepID=A0AAV8G0P9_9POAL|nr:Leucine-rich repeat protein kinase family protein [Rhynchospora pubera]